MIDKELSRLCGLQYILDKLEPMSPFGAEQLRGLSLFERREELSAELDRVRRLAQNGDFALLAPAMDRELMAMKDIRHSLRRCAGGGSLTMPELFELKGLLLALGRLGPLYAESCPLPGLDFSDSREALAVLDPRGEGKRSFTIEDAATPELFALRREKRAVEAELYKTENDARRTELRLRREDICAREDAQEREVCAALSEKLAPFCPGLLADCEAAGHLDLLLRKAMLLRRQKTVIPVIREGDIAFRAMTNPELAQGIAHRGGDFVPVSVSLSRGAAVITGANMGGKTVALKTLALNVLLAMAGFPVFAEAAGLPMVGDVRFLAGDAEQSGKGLSTFGGEVLRLREALEHFADDTLLLLDEPARGTNPDEGAAIVRGLVEYLNGRAGFAVAATHYDGVARHAGRHYRIVGLRDMDPAALEKELAVSSAPGPEVIARHMDYGLYPCGPEEPCPREALDICRLLGLGDEVMENIRKFYSN